MRKFVLIGFAMIAAVVVSASAQAAQSGNATNTRDAYAPFEDLIQITPSDATVYDPPLRGCIIESAGDIAVKPIKSAASVTITVLKGQLLPAIMTQILATGTTATMVCGR